MSMLSTAIFWGVLARLLTWKGIVLLSIPLLIIFWATWGDQEEQIKSKGVMSIAIDSETKLPIIDISVNNPIGDQSFHAAVYDKDFLIKGVQTTIVVTQKNPEKNARNRDDFEIYFYSDILNTNCLSNLKNAIQDITAEGASVEDLVVKTCGKSVFPHKFHIPSKQIANYETIKNICSGEQPCGSCLIISGEESMKGNCELEKAIFHDFSRSIKSGNSEQIILDVRPIKKLSYMSYVPR